MDSEKFIEECRKNLVKLCNRMMNDSRGNPGFKESDFYVVWSSKTLQNNKAMMSTDTVMGLYFELTYDGDAKAMYIDVYEHRKNICVKD